MQDDSMDMEYICALLCLHSSLKRYADDPSPLSRKEVRRLLSDGSLKGLVLKESGRLAPERIEQARILLSRASSIYDSIRHYRENGIRILSEGDMQWPQRLGKLGEQMPLYLFAIGNLKLLENRSIAVAGSRAIGEATQEIAERIGYALARKGLTVVSGGARGIDRTVQRAVLESGGNVVIVPAMPVSKLLMEEELRKALDAGQLLILCETPPEEVFSAQKAIKRNHTIYALGDCALVVAARKGRGGSWAGATACIKGKWSPTYVLDAEGEDFHGNAALLEMGAFRMSLLGNELFFEDPDFNALKQYGVSKQMSFDAAYIHPHEDRI